MVGGGPFHLRPGDWTDDTSMALCLATSLVECQGFNADDQMQRYCRWKQDGYLSSNGRCFDIGGTTAAALRKYKETGDPYAGSTEPSSAGNGSIMRLAPVALFFHPDADAVVKWSGDSSRTTHGAQVCIDACQLLGWLICRALDGVPKEDLLFRHSGFPCGVESLAPRIQSIATGEYRDRPEAAIKGTGYVVASLEAALWSFWATDSFEAAILKAVNLGDDADTTGAVCGQIAGAFYGVDGIPHEWLEKVVMREQIADLADRLLDP